jgi:hypothetical protein
VIREFRDRHKNDPCFIYGAGPSLRLIDIDPLKKYISISVNSGIVKAPFSNYFITDDIGVKNWSYFISLLPMLKCISFLYKEKLSNFASHLTNIVWTHHKEDKKLDRGDLLINARTSVGSAVHLAYIMGCNPIILLGVDCCYCDKNRYFWQYLPINEQPYRITREKVYSKPSHGFIDKKPVDKHCLDFIKYWNNFAEVNKDIIGKEVDIINCTEGNSVLNCFENKNIKNILKEIKK